MNFPWEIYARAEREAVASQLPGRQDGPADAYRHILAAAEAVRQGYPESVVRAWGEWRERDNPPDRAAMDKHNNDVGIGIGKNARSWQEVLERARKAVSNGSTNSTDPNTASWRPPSEWDGNPKNDATPDPNDRLPTTETNWPPRWPPQGIPSPDDPNWWREFPFPGTQPKECTPYDLDGNGIPDRFEPLKFSPLGDIFNRAKNWVWPRDPIILDLDGDGLETVGLASNVYFDHDGDGVLTKTGWAGANDALLVWDRNGNGTIDTGAELFGDFTVLPNGTLAPNGFAALAALDANGDGVIDATDPAFAELKLWRDISQDGVSQGGELVSLADAGIVSLNLANTLKNQNLANGNQLTREGSFTRADGSTSAMGEFRLATDTFNTRFAEPVEVPEALKTLPTMGGAGNVRELQQAAAQSSSLASVLAQFQNAGTRAEQKALLDQLITAWADTSGMAKSLEERAAGKYRIVYEAFGNERRASHIDTVAFAAVSSGSVGGSGGGAALMIDFGGMYLSERYRNLISEWSRKLHVLEAFNGQYFFNLPEKKSQTDG